MTKAQKDNQLRFKKAQAEAKRLKAKNPKLTHTEAVKQAFKNLGGTSAKPAAKKVGAVKSKGSIAGVFKFAGAGFQDVRQFDIYGDLSYIIEDRNGKKITEIIANPKNNKLAAEKIYAYVLRQGYGSDLDQPLETKIKKFVKQLQTEAAEYNKGKKSSAKPAKSFITAAAAKAPAKKKKAVKKEYVTILGQRVLKGSKAYKKLAYTKKHSDDLIKSETSRYKPKKQTGTTNISIDRKIQAMPPGKRISKKGNVYYEVRANRSDKGRLLGVKNTDVIKKPIGLYYDNKLIKQFDTVAQSNKYQMNKVYEGYDRNLFYTQNFAFPGIKKVGAVKKPAISKHKDTNSHNVKISVVSGVGKFHAHQEYKKILDYIEGIERLIENNKKEIKDLTSLKSKYPEQVKYKKDKLNKELVYLKKLLSEYKTHARELKKLL